MNFETLTKEQAELIVSWARTDAGQLFNEYILAQQDPTIQALTDAANMRDVFRAQGSLQMLERVLHFFAFATGVADGTITTNSGDDPEGQEVSDFPAPWGPSVDDGSGVGGA